MNQSPRWIDFSGLPEELNTKASPHGWATFKRLLELDCLQNPESPDIIREPVDKLAQSLGLPSVLIRQILESLIDLALVKAYLPTQDMEEALFQIRTPLPTPISWKDIPIDDGGQLGADSPLRLRYTQVADENMEETPKIRQILHWYTELCGLKLNTQITEDLMEIEKQFELEEIRNAFETAKRNKRRSLRSVFKILYEVKDTPKPGTSNDIPDKGE